MIEKKTTYNIITIVISSFNLTYCISINILTYIIIKIIDSLNGKEIFLLRIKELYY